MEDAERLVAVWNERQQRQMPMLFSPTIGTAIAAGNWFLWVRCPACRTINAIDLRTLDRHADLVRLSRKSVADEIREERQRRVLGKNRMG
jgi:phage FluMu protein Com